MKYLMLVLIMVGLLTAEMLGKAETDYLVTLDGQNHEVLSYNPTVDALILATLGVGGAINAHSAPGGLSFWVHDPIYGSQFGPAYYPSTYAGQEPYISFPYSIGGNWGGMAGVYEPGGWFSAMWNPPVDISSGDVNTHKNIVKELPTGDMLFIGITNNREILYRTFSADLNDLIDSGIVAAGMDYWGYDATSGIAYVFYYDTLGVYYKTTIDGINWSFQQSWDLAFTPPTYYNIIHTQMVLTETDAPLLIFDCVDTLDTLYPPYSKVYISHSSGVPPINLVVAFPDTEAFYPTIAVGSNYAVAVFNIPRNNHNDTLSWLDIFKCVSTDNGLTWGNPENITAWSNSRIGQQQIAKRIDTIRNLFYYVYADLDSHEIFVKADPILGIAEKYTYRLENVISIFPSPTKRWINLKYHANQFSAMRIGIYDPTGKMVKSIGREIIPEDKKILRLDLWDLPSGIYFINLESETEKIVKSFVLLK